MPYSATDYWAGLHAAGHNESTVGYPELPVAFNRAMYDALIAATSKLLADHAIAPDRVLDIGSGTGIWVDFWLRAGVREVVGVDLAQQSVDALRERLPQATFEQADVSRALPDGPFDAISAMSVLLHVTDDAAWRRALDNLAGALAPGGHLVIIDAALVHTWHGPPFDSGSSSVVRRLDQWRQGLADAGLELVDVRPATVLLANVSDTRSRYAFAALWRFWGLLQQGLRGRERAGAAVGAALKLVDRPLRAVLPHGPSAKLLLARKPPA